MSLVITVKFNYQSSYPRNWMEPVFGLARAINNCPGISWHCMKNFAGTDKAKMKRTFLSIRW